MNVADFLDCGTLISLPNGHLLIGWGPRQWMCRPEKGDLPSFYYPDFFLENQNAWFQHKHWKETTIDNLIKELGECSEKTSLSWNPGDQKLFFDTFHDLQKKFLAKDLVKAVPFSFKSSQTPMNTKILHHSLLHLLQYTKNSPLHLYGFWDKNEGMLGATPELLCSINGNSLTTVALAGTCSKASSSQHLLKSPKDLHEHQVVVEGIKKSLTPFGQVKIGQLSILELPTLYHLMTPIEVTLVTNAELKDILISLHPTPALGAFPREAGTYWLRSIQTQIDRRRFGAPVGVCAPQLQLNHYLVAIRNVQWNTKEMLIGAGCGVVPTSNPESEWNEILLKMNATQQMLDL